MKLGKRGSGPQSMVEHGLGIAAAASVCLVILSGLGHASADIVNCVLVSINDADEAVQDPGTLIKSGMLASAPWLLR